METSCKPGMNRLDRVNVTALCVYQNSNINANAEDYRGRLSVEFDNVPPPTRRTMFLMLLT